MFAGNLPGRGGAPQNKNLPGIYLTGWLLVGVTGFEPMASPTRTARSTKLSYTPNKPKYK
jgi:hypothetical protein